MHMNYTKHYICNSSGESAKRFASKFINHYSMSRFILVIASILTLSPFISKAQSKDSSGSQFKLTAYLDAYYARYSDSVGVGNFQKFAAESPKHNELGLNIAQITASYTATKVRATITLHYGDLVTSAWSPVYNMIQEANMGIQLHPKLWLDAGFFKTHVGTEALLPKDNIATSISIITLYEPWFQSGAKLSYIPNDKYVFCLHILNGYNTFVDNNSKKSVGITVFYAPNDKFNVGYYNLIGDEMPDSLKNPHVRFLNNLVFNYQFTPKLKGLAGFDFISQQNSQLKDPTKTASIYSAILTLKYQMHKKLSVYGRFEMMSDADGFLAGTITDATGAITGYKLTGYTAGLEAKITETSYFRLEGRDLVMDENQKIFRTNGQMTNTRLEGMLNFGIWF